MGRITLHTNPAIPWHRQHAGAFEKGLKAIGWAVTRSHSRTRINADPAVLFGTSGYKAIESAPGDWLLVDRACWGDPEYVRLGWNGRGLEADYRIPEVAPARWIPEVEPTESGDRVVLCGDYGALPRGPATHYRPHPADPSNPTGLPVWESFDGVKAAICGMSTVAVEFRLRGIPVSVDMRSIANLSLADLSWTQWSWSEIEEGEPIRHLFEWLM